MTALRSQETCEHPEETLEPLPYKGKPPVSGEWECGACGFWNVLPAPTFDDFFAARGLTSPVVLGVDLGKPFFPTPPTPTEFDAFKQEASVPSWDPSVLANVSIDLSQDVSAVDPMDSAAAYIVLPRSSTLMISGEVICEEKTRGLFEIMRMTQDISRATARSVAAKRYTWDVSRRLLYEMRTSSSSYGDPFTYAPDRIAPYVFGVPITVRDDFRPNGLRAVVSIG